MDGGQNHDTQTIIEMVRAGICSIRVYFMDHMVGGWGMSKKKKYKWSSPYEWLLEKSLSWPLEQCRMEMLNLARLHDQDVLQDEYQLEMDEDGYFDETED